jgi:hypothetical protein
MALPVLKYNSGDTKTIPFQVRKKDKITPENITGLIFRFFAKDEPGDATYLIDPVTATITDAENGEGEFQDVLMPTVTENKRGLYWIEREDGVGKIDTFQPAEGTEIRILLK